MKETLYKICQRFSMTRILSYKERIVDSALVRGNRDQ